MITKTSTKTNSDMTHTVIHIQQRHTKIRSDTPYQTPQQLHNGNSLYLTFSMGPHKFYMQIRIVVRESTANNVFDMVTVIHTTTHQLSNPPGTDFFQPAIIHDLYTHQLILNCSNINHKGTHAQAYKFSRSNLVRPIAHSQRTSKRRVWHSCIWHCT